MSMTKDIENGLFVAFAGDARIAQGALADVAASALRATARDQAVRDQAVGVLVFDAAGRVRDLDLRGGETDVLERCAAKPAPPSKRGRPKLGVTAREVTLLPRHWEWLAAQPGGASVALRRLVEAANKAVDPAAASRARREAAYRFMSAMAGDRPGFEDAARALFAGDEEKLATLAKAWPADIVDQVQRYLGGDQP